MIFTICRSVSELEDIRLECLVSIKKLYADLKIIQLKEEQKIFENLVHEYGGDLDHPAFHGKMSGVLVSDLERLYILRDNPQSIYFDTDIQLLHHLDFSGRCAFGWNGAVGDPHIMKSGDSPDIYDKILRRWVPCPPIRPICTSILWFFDTQKVPYDIIKSGYTHLALGSQNGWVKRGHTKTHD